MGLLDLVKVQDQSDSDLDPVTYNPKYIAKDDFYRKHQFSYMPNHVMTQTNQIESSSFGVQIENGWERNAPRKPRAKS